MEWAIFSTAPRQKANPPSIAATIEITTGTDAEARGLTALTIHTGHTSRVGEMGEDIDIKISILQHSLYTNSRPGAYSATRHSNINDSVRHLR